MIIDIWEQPIPQWGEGSCLSLTASSSALRGPGRHRGSEMLTLLLRISMNGHLAEGSVPPPSTWGTWDQSMNLECSVLRTNILPLSFLPDPQRSEPWRLRTQGWMLIPRCSKKRSLGARDECTSSWFPRGGTWGLWAGIQAPNDFP